MIFDNYYILSINAFLLLLSTFTQLFVFLYLFHCSLIFWGFLVNTFKALSFLVSILSITPPRVFYVMFLFITPNSVRICLYFLFYSFNIFKHLICVRHCGKSCIIPKITYFYYLNEIICTSDPNVQFVAISF